ncbi:hypothetical protein OIHEL45_15464 [Sulfitobacter indolifex HEL-45]|uniref:Uncharacterized protein n=1 Tax=Sulfitobacter indolifex HEL-45 TaxID=391624 RepID=A0ABP2D7T1_9RHOB|nr:hypothetical protein OIHEL45_15464 [Sulfitobacter indolifex HEL-45]
MHFLVMQAVSQLMHNPIPQGFSILIHFDQVPNSVFAADSPVRKLLYTGKPTKVLFELYSIKALTKTQNNSVIKVFNDELPQHPAGVFFK